MEGANPHAPARGAGEGPTTEADPTADMSHTLPELPKPCAQTNILQTQNETKRKKPSAYPTPKERATGEGVCSGGVCWVPIPGRNDLPPVRRAAFPLPAGRAVLGRSSLEEGRST